jgi:hypothetical protein
VPQGVITPILRAPEWANPQDFLGSQRRSGELRIKACIIELRKIHNTRYPHTNGTFGGAHVCLLRGQTKTKELIN